MSVRFPRMTCIHATEHAIDLGFKEMYIKIPKLKELVCLTRKAHNVLLVPLCINLLTCFAVKAKNITRGLFSVFWVYTLP